MVLPVTTVVHDYYSHVGLGLKLYPSNMSHILNKDFTVFLKYAKIERVKERFCWKGFRSLITIANDYVL